MIKIENNRSNKCLYVRVFLLLDSKHKKNELLIFNKVFIERGHVRTMAATGTYCALVNLRF